MCVFFLSAPRADSVLLLFSLLRSSSTSEESSWTRSRRPRTLGSARLWAPWRALPHLPPAPRPRPRLLLRRALPRWPFLRLSVPCWMHTSRAEKHKLNKQAAEKCSIPFWDGDIAKLSSFLDCKTAESMSEESQGGEPGLSDLMFTFEWTRKCLCFTADETGAVKVFSKLMLPLFCWVISLNSDLKLK